MLIILKTRLTQPESSVISRMFQYLLERLSDLDKLSGCVENKSHTLQYQLLLNLIENETAIYVNNFLIVLDEFCCSCNSKHMNLFIVSNMLSSNDPLFLYVTVVNWMLCICFILPLRAVHFVDNVLCCRYLRFYLQYFEALLIGYYQYINIRRDWSGKGVNGEGGSDETTVLWTRYQGKCRKFGTDSLGGQYRWFMSPRKTQKTMDGRHRRVEWL